MSEARPYFPFYPKDWLPSTRGLSSAARGYHIDMLALAWLNGGCDADPETLRRSVGAEKAEWRKVWPELQARWQEVEGRLVNRKLEEVRAEMTAYTEARRQAGRKGGKASANAKQTPSKDEANGQAKSNPAFASASASALASVSDETHTARPQATGVPDDPYLSDPGEMPNRKRPLWAAWESRRGLHVQRFLHEEFLGKLGDAGTEDDLRRWYAETEAALGGRPVGDEPVAFWRARFREWQGTTVAPITGRKADTSGWVPPVAVGGVR